MPLRRRVRSPLRYLFLVLCELGAVGGAAAQVPRPDHVVIVIDENHSYSEIIGSPAAPYINSLAAQGALFTNSTAITHPSEPNYLALFSGSTQGVSNDYCPLTFNTANLAASLIAASLGFGGYSEDMPSVGYTGCSFNNYARKHNPWVNFTNVPASVNLPFTSFPSGTDYSSLPTVSIVVPNLVNDMHDGSIQQGDSWLQQHIDNYVQWASTQNSLLIFTFDEDDFTSVNQIATIFVGPMVQPGQYGEAINHYNVLRTVEDMYGVARAGASATAAPITDCWRPTITNQLAVYLDFNDTLDGLPGSGHDGQLWTGAARYVPGRIGDAASFRNSGGGGLADDFAVTLGNLGALFAGDFSIAMWVRTSSMAAGAIAGNKDFSDMGNTGWGFDTANAAWFDFTPEGATARDLGTELRDGAFHHVAAVFDRAAHVVRVYKDSASDGAVLGTLSTQAMDAGLDTLIGASGPGTYGATVDVDDFAIWTRALTDAEVSTIYDNGLAGQPIVAIDRTAPTPNPMSFDVPPYGVTGTSIAMTATTASDPSGVEYYFTCASPGCHDSGWQTSPAYTDTGLQAGASYAYAVTARDRSIMHNQTAASAVLTGMTIPDSTAPTPNPAQFETKPKTVNNTSITMSAKTASDANGVEYDFRCVAGPCHDSGWQSGRTYTDTGLLGGYTYSYRVVVRDMSLAHNETAPSVAASAKITSTVATTVHVGGIQLSTVSVGQLKAGKAIVSVLNNLNKPVQGVSVLGTFTGAFNEPTSAVTDAQGKATSQTTQAVSGSPHFTFCVTALQHSSLGYDAGGNHATCVTK